ncbi:UDP-N-acetylglucosamine--N-acetylmuramyl-(pentapeptide) pyrophosphoryl-undecaprenol N-acetylglucosamine transferase [Candidatus Fokinia solitaria]|uniref:UDP-N-acetylglucosamine--N-acetylmuramyl-(Pentapeptide) pyrophosphoryl-undecaprenol N-acetylglucosamine transferase n=1 Tax=Candidatus Fokinia solitaria TaxID=1802984 RepID=A0A2U8BRT3_9RICK|nr:glycosyltransferase [Candidatus Fokinia solitaria]AWD32980.1 UDP-N-acetylglucosamine--N-acetylmuramyl-(pentapeptide) pyrophosphoryl-undecaprenol N-acetylglucosamine transferase [Candidatus Fokinia solitaria]
MFSIINKFLHKGVIISTGGTGGHVFPALEIAKHALQHCDVVLMVDRRGHAYIEENTLELLKKIAKQYDRKFVFNVTTLHHSAKLKFIFDLIKQLYIGVRIAIKYNYSVCIGMGGYATAMPIIAFTLCNLLRFSTFNILLCEQNATLGKVNRVFANYLPNTTLLTTYKDIVLPRTNVPVVHLGFIVREEFKHYKETTHSKLDDCLRLFMLGGSQGAATLTMTLAEIISKLHIDTDIRVYQQISKYNDVETIKALYAKNKAIQSCDIRHFFADCCSIMAQSDIIISRAGSSTIGEILTLNKKAILVPLPNSTDEHQLLNARYIKAHHGNIYLIEQKDLNMNSIKEAITILSNSSNKK